MDWYKASATLALLLITIFSLCDAQLQNPRPWQVGRGGIYELENTNAIATGVTISKSKVPYVEVLRLVQAFLNIKGELAGRLWTLFNDNAHIVAAFRETLVNKIAGLHNFTLSFIIILRKILEFAAPLFSNVSAGFTFG